MSTERATFAVELRDEVSAPAGDAVAALQQLRERLEAGTRRLREMQQAMQRLKGSSVVSADAIRELRARMDAEKASIASAQSAFLALGGTFGETTRRTQETKQGLAALMEGAKGLGGPLGALAERGEKFARAVASQPVIAGTLALGVGVVALAAAAVAASIALARLTFEATQYALVTADAQRAEQLRIEGLLTLSEYQRGGATSARELMDAIDLVASSSAAGRGQVTGLGEQLYRAGLRGHELTSALEAASIASSVQGQRGAAQFVAQARAAHQAGRSVQGLADAVRTRLGGIAQRQALGFDVQVNRLREDIVHLFSGLDLDRFLSGMREVTSLFSQSTASGRAMREIINTVFQGIFDGAGSAGTVLRRMMQTAIILALRLAIVYATVRNALVAAFGGSDVLHSSRTIETAMWAVRFAAVGLITALATIALVVAIPIAAFAAFTIACGEFGALIGDTISKARLFITLWQSSGSSLVDGFVNGIRSRLSEVRSTVVGMATQATEAFQNALLIRSPSRVFAELGRQLPAGLAVGIEDGAPVAERAAGRMVGDVAGGARGSSSAPLIGELHVHASGDAESIAAATRDALVDILRGLQLEMGAA